MVACYLSFKFWQSGLEEGHEVFHAVGALAYVPDVLEFDVLFRLVWFSKGTRCSFSSTFDL